MFNSTNDRDLAHRLADGLAPARPAAPRLAILAAIEAARQVLADDARRLPFRPTDAHTESLINRAVLLATNPAGFDWSSSTPSARAARSAYETFS